MFKLAEAFQFSSFILSQFATLVSLQQVTNALLRIG
jgi:hypothetical protein